ncbi:MAG: type III polyketide synthase [Acidobacteria bacterium]|nr:type III polyketide synthase [Acidobacteriota bacterium]
MTEAAFDGPHVASLAVSVPPFRIPQAQVREICRTHFRSLSRIERLLEILDHSGVEFRHFCFPPEYYLAAHDVRQSSKDFLEQAIALASEAILKALRGEPAESIDHVICVTTTGVNTPSLEAHLYNHLGLRPDVRRTPLFGTGCAGAVNAVALARDFALAHPDSRTLVLAVELCGQTFQSRDFSIRNLIAVALFGDGVAALLVDGARKRGGGPQILATRSELIPRSLHVMGWDVTDKGLELILSPRVDDYVRDHLPGIVDSLLKENGLELSDIEYCVFHPGGPKILSAYQEAFSLAPEALRFSREVLRCYGNVSSASVLFVLKDVLDSAKPAAGESALLAAMGPGFAAELALLRF